MATQKWWLIFSVYTLWILLLTCIALHNLRAYLQSRLEKSISIRAPYLVVVNHAIGLGLMIWVRWLFTLLRLLQFRVPAAFRFGAGMSAVIVFATIFIMRAWSLNWRYAYSRYLWKRQWRGQLNLVGGELMSGIDEEWAARYAWLFRDWRNLSVYGVVFVVLSVTCISVVFLTLGNGIGIIVLAAYTIPLLTSLVIAIRSTRSSRDIYNFRTEVLVVACIWILFVLTTPLLNYFFPDPTSLGFTFAFNFRGSMFQSVQYFIVTRWVIWKNEHTFYSHINDRDYEPLPLLNLFSCGLCLECNPPCQSNESLDDLPPDAPGVNRLASRSSRSSTLRRQSDPFPKAVMLLLRNSTEDGTDKRPLTAADLSGLFSRVMADSIGFKIFAEHCVREMCVEGVLFVVSYMRWKQLLYSFVRFLSEADLLAVEAPFEEPDDIADVAATVLKSAAGSGSLTAFHTDSSNEDNSAAIDFLGPQKSAPFAQRSLSAPPEGGLADDVKASFTLAELFKPAPSPRPAKALRSRSHNSQSSIGRIPGITHKTGDPLTRTISAPNPNRMAVKVTLVDRRPRAVTSQAIDHMTPPPAAIDDGYVTDNESVSDCPDRRSFRSVSVTIDTEQQPPSSAKVVSPRIMRSPGMDHSSNLEDHEDMATPKPNILQVSREVLSVDSMGESASEATTPMRRVETFKSQTHTLAALTVRSERSRSASRRTLKSGLVRENTATRSRGFRTDTGGRSSPEMEKSHSSRKKSVGISARVTRTLRLKAKTQRTDHRDLGLFSEKLLHEGGLSEWSDIPGLAMSTFGALINLPSDLIVLEKKPQTESKMSLLSPKGAKSPSGNLSLSLDGCVHRLLDIHDLFLSTDGMSSLNIAGQSRQAALDMLGLFLMDQDYLTLDMHHNDSSHLPNHKVSQLGWKGSGSSELSAHPKKALPDSKLDLESPETKRLRREFQRKKTQRKLDTENETLQNLFDCIKVLDTVLSQTLSVLRHDSFPRFLESMEFKTWAQTVSNNGKQSLMP